MLRGFIFDLDGVITDTANLHYLAWKKELGKYQIDYSAEENELLKGLSRQDTLKKILKLKNISNQFTEKEINQICDNKNNQYKQMLKTQLNSTFILPGIENLLKKLKKFKIKIALASSSHNAKLILKKLDLFKYFDFIVNPKNVKNGKPAPDIFLTAIKGINLEPKECIAIEDAPSGIEAINKAGIFSIAISSQKNKNSFLNANLIINLASEINLKELKKIFNN